VQHHLVQSPAKGERLVASGAPRVRAERGFGKGSKDPRAARGLGEQPARPHRRRQREQAVGRRPLGPAVDLPADEGEDGVGESGSQQRFCLARADQAAPDELCRQA
jgi:hypothetical protein